MAGETKSKLKLTNATQGVIILTLGPAVIKDGRMDSLPSMITISPMNIGRPVIVEGDAAAVLQKDAYFQLLVDNKDIIVDRDGKMGEEKRATSEPQAPADLVEKTTVGNEVGRVSGLQRGVKLDKFDIQAAQ